MPLAEMTPAEVVAAIGWNSAQTERLVETDRTSAALREQAAVTVRLMGLVRTARPADWDGATFGEMLERHWRGAA
jgi:hypothetical protein